MVLVVVALLAVLTHLKVRPLIDPDPIHAEWDLRADRLDLTDSERTATGREVFPLGSIHVIFDDVTFTDDRDELSSAQLYPVGEDCPQLDHIAVFYRLPGDDPEAEQRGLAYAQDLVERLRAAGVDMVDDPEGDAAALEASATDPSRTRPLRDELARGRATAGGNPYDLQVWVWGAGVYLYLVNSRFSRSYAASFEQQLQLDECIPLTTVGDPWSH